MAAGGGWRHAEQSEQTSRPAGPAADRYRDVKALITAIKVAGRAL